MFERHSGGHYDLKSGLLRDYCRKYEVIHLLTAESTGEYKASSFSISVEERTNAQPTFAERHNIKKAASMMMRRPSRFIILKQ